jgi:hypothetical protein
MMPRPSKGTVPAHLSLINSLLASLLNEERYIRTIPTWPWEPGALRGLLTALFLPLALFAAQRLIEQFLLS